jgi:hypothetical protein
MKSAISVVSLLLSLQTVQSENIISALAQGNIGMTQSPEDILQEQMSLLAPQSSTLAQTPVSNESDPTTWVGYESDYAYSKAPEAQDLTNLSYRSRYYSRRSSYSYKPSSYSYSYSYGYNSGYHPTYYYNPCAGVSCEHCCINGACSSEEECKANLMWLFIILPIICVLIIVCIVMSKRGGHNDSFHHSSHYSEHHSSHHSSRRNSFHEH